MQAITRFFTADHKRLDDIFDAFESHRDTDLKLAAKTFGVFSAGLLKHLRWEEELLFPILDGRTNMGAASPTHLMRNEHALIRECCAAIETGLLAQNSAAVEQAVSEIIEVLHAHYHKAEHVLCPITDQLLNDQEKDQLLAKTDSLR